MNTQDYHYRTSSAVSLLTKLIAIPSLSRQENITADCIEAFFAEHGIPTQRRGNNIFAVNKFFDGKKPSILLNSHHDTVPPNESYTRDPFNPLIDNGKIYGLGSTDAGASLACLVSAFIHFYENCSSLCNLVIAASAEEEISGKNGIEMLFTDPLFKGLFSMPGSFALVGEPTQLQLAIAEKGLLVLDCAAFGSAGHAARNEGENAIYNAMEAINWIKNYKFPKISLLLGAVQMSVTSISTENRSHNVTPASCHFVIDVRLNELYSHEEVLEIIAKNTVLKISARSTRLKASVISPDHPVVLAGLKLGASTFGSPTMSDQALIPLPSVKCGPGYSGQSHQADEFILLEDINNGVSFYISLLEDLL